jgi:Ca-activated chloride channel homolog
VFRFFQEHFLWLLLLIPALAAFYWAAFRRKRRDLERFGNPALVALLTASVSRRRQVLKTVLVTAAVLFLVLALARPQFGTKLRTVKREGQDIVVALDVSLSMQAEDIKPNRLEKAKHEIASMIDKFQGDRIALVAFAGKAFVQCPLTLDYGAAKMFLDAMTPDLIPVPGTAVKAAIEASVTCFSAQDRKHKVLVLITDGEDHAGDPVDAAKAAAKEGVVIYTVGLGSPEGVPIPTASEAGAAPGGFKKNRSGEVVMTKLDEVSLEKIALETGGKYYRATPGEVELERIYDDILKMEKKSLASRQFTQFEERFQIPLAFAIILLALEAALPERRRVKKEWRGRFE